MTHRPLLFIGAALAALAPVATAHANGDSEAQKQATRLISQAISQRIGATTDLQTPGGAELTGRANWGLLSYTNIGSDAGGLGDFDIDLVQGSYGWDRDAGNSIVGISVSANYGTMDAGGLDGDFYGVSVTPYGAIKVNDNFFWSGLVGFAVSAFDSGGVSATNSNIFGEAAANFVGRGENSTFRAKLAYRPNYSMPEEGDSDFTSTAVAFAEADFGIGETSSWYVNAEVNYSLDDDAGANDETPVYVGTGLMFDSSPTSEWGIGYQTVLNYGDIDIHTVLVQGRWRF